MKIKFRKVQLIFFHRKLALKTKEFSCLVNKLSVVLTTLDYKLHDKIGYVGYLEHFDGRFHRHLALLTQH